VSQIFGKQLVIEGSTKRCEMKVRQMEGHHLWGEKQGGQKNEKWITLGRSTEEAGVLQL